jgi:hypothetical protein
LRSNEARELQCGYDASTETYSGIKTPSSLRVNYRRKSCHADQEARRQEM